MHGVWSTLYFLNLSEALFQRTDHGPIRHIILSRDRHNDKQASQETCEGSRLLSRQSEIHRRGQQGTLGLQRSG